eukprot:747784-Hanusia_phi.AAC.4
MSTLTLLITKFPPPPLISRWAGLPDRLHSASLTTEASPTGVSGKLSQVYLRPGTGSPTCDGWHQRQRAAGSSYSSAHLHWIAERDDRTFASTPRVRRGRSFFLRHGEGKNFTRVLFFLLLLFLSPPVRRLCGGRGRALSTRLG